MSRLDVLCLVSLSLFIVSAFILQSAPNTLLWLFALFLLIISVPLLALTLYQLVKMRIEEFLLISVLLVSLFLIFFLGFGTCSYPSGFMFINLTIGVQAINIVILTCLGYLSLAIILLKWKYSNK